MSAEEREEPGTMAQRLAGILRERGISLPPGRITMGFYDDRMKASIVMDLSSRGRGDKTPIARRMESMKKELGNFRERVREAGMAPDELAIAHSQVSVANAALQGLAGAVPVGVLGAALSAQGTSPFLALGAGITMAACWALYTAIRWSRQMDQTQGEMVRSYQSFQNDAGTPERTSISVRRKRRGPTMVVQITPEEE